jgi:hypothetical protein
MKTAQLTTFPAGNLQGLFQRTPAISIAAERDQEVLKENLIAVGLQRPGFAPMPGRRPGTQAGRDHGVQELFARPRDPSPRPVAMLTGQIQYRFGKVDLPIQ